MAGDSGQLHTKSAKKVKKVKPKFGISPLMSSLDPMDWDSQQEEQVH
jgi:hypothetical protein